MRGCPPSHLFPFLEGCVFTAHSNDTCIQIDQHQTISSGVGRQAGAESGCKAVLGSGTTFAAVLESAQKRLSPFQKRIDEDNSEMAQLGFHDSKEQGFGQLSKSQVSLPLRRRGPPKPQMSAAQLARHSSDPVPLFHVSKIQERAIKKNEQKKADSTGRRWFNMPAVELTEEAKKELQVLKVRACASECRCNQLALCVCVRACVRVCACVRACVCVWSGGGVCLLFG